jgi:dTDP-glucose 4,6-dehydratase
MYLISAYKFLKFPMNVLRPSNAYCPGQLLHRVIPMTIYSILTGKKFYTLRKKYLQLHYKESY